MNHPTEKIELIIMGGTFLEYPKKFQEDFVKKCFDAMNSKKSKTLEEAQKKNEKAKHRCVALCIETRPDICSEKDIAEMRKLGATRVELGVQIIDDKIYKKIKRGHKIKDVVKATQRLKDAGFKVGYHIMPGLPGSTPKKDLELFKKLFSDENFKPDQLKIYPCQVMPSSELEKIYWKKQYEPYSKKVIQTILIKMLKLIPRYCRVMRVMREIPPEFLVAGTINIDLRKDIEEGLRKGKFELKEIRYREIGFALRGKREIDKNLKLKITNYDASGGKELFLEIVNSDDILFGLLRLRFPKKTFLKELKDCALIREIHVYGKALNLGEISALASQHQGLGKWMMNEAEKICKKNNFKKIAVISGIGVRGYYKKLGYKLEGSYMVKEIK